MELPNSNPFPIHSISRQGIEESLLARENHTPESDQTGFERPGQVPPRTKPAYRSAEGCQCKPEVPHRPGSRDLRNHDRLLGRQTGMKTARTAEGTPRRPPTGSAVPTPRDGKDAVRAALSGLSSCANVVRRLYHTARATGNDPDVVSLADCRPESGRQSPRTAAAVRRQ